MRDRIKKTGEHWRRMRLQQLSKIFQEPNKKKIQNKLLPILLAMV
jgi:hypothetical protein